WPCRTGSKAASAPAPCAPRSPTCVRAWHRRRSVWPARSAPRGSPAHRPAPPAVHCSSRRAPRRTWPARHWRRRRPRPRGRAAPRLDGAATLADPVAVEQLLVPVRKPLADAEQALQQAEARLADLSGLDGLEKALAAAVSTLSAANLTPAQQADVQVLHAQALQALSAADLALARGRIDRLRELAAQVDLAYELRIVSRPNEQSGVWRHPQGNPNVRNYYIIVEAIGPDGRPVELPITSEEDQVQR